jgi:ADP-ribose pyrophosphatase YjhB (NUDIX family)
MNYCCDCGATVDRRWVPEDKRERFVCSSCGRVHYLNPRVLVTCLVEHRGRVLLCQRAQDPGKGRWSAPGGFVEYGETLEQAVVRETQEETGVAVEDSQLHLHVISSLHWISEIYVTFRASVSDSHIRVGPECLDARFFASEEIPWEQLAFVEFKDYLRLFFRELHCNQYGIHSTRLSEHGGHRRQYRIADITDIFVADPVTSRSATISKN